MTRITAIELENFQSIEQRTRIELKPITLLFGPNSAGKSSVFDALELIRVLLDPTMFNEELAADMVDRWARRKGDEAFRETFLAIEFPYEFLDEVDVWFDDSNWKRIPRRTETAGFSLDHDPVERGLLGSTIRIEILAKVVNNKQETNCYISEFSYSINERPLISLTKFRRDKHDPEDLDYINSSRECGGRWLTLFDTFDEVNYRLFQNLKKRQADDELPDWVLLRNEVGDLAQVQVDSQSLNLANFTIQGQFNTNRHYLHFDDITSQIGIRATEFIFYFGTLLWGPSRGKPGIVLADRRSPTPSEALTVVDLGLKGWWNRQSFSPSSPATLLMAASDGGDEHYRGLAAVTYADLLLRTANSDDWGSSHSSENIEEVRKKSLIIEKINHHLSRNLFTEKLYKLSCAATLMVPIDLELDDPWGYYALAQPAAVRLFLEDGEGRKVELQDVGSGIPFVLPILYAVASQGIVKVQQPELHLHPALQSSMADIFIEEFNRSGAGQFIIETHSEHVLLRLLRRIRDVEKGKCLSDDMMLTNKDIAVYYFDPQVSGGTSVTQQLVTPLGDFYTDWPRGFFGERNRDLFDE